MYKDAYPSLCIEAHDDGALGERGYVRVFMAVDIAAVLQNICVAHRLKESLDRIELLLVGERHLYSLEGCGLDC